VILDVGLPDMSGFDICRALRRHSEVPVIFLTAHAEEVDRVVGLELGADDYVAKPFSPRELVSRVRAILRRTRPHSQSGGDTADADALQAARRRLPGANIFGVRKESVDFRVYVSDAQGIVAFDSENEMTGSDFSRWKDIASVLRGEYGAAHHAAPRGKTRICRILPPCTSPRRFSGRASALACFRSPNQPLPCCPHRPDFFLLADALDSRLHPLRAGGQRWRKGESAHGAAGVSFPNWRAP
jgi:CheY-like chemotaxis protein